MKYLTQGTSSIVGTKLDNEMNDAVVIRKQAADQSNEIQCRINRVMKQDERQNKYIKDMMIRQNFVKSMNEEKEHRYTIQK